MGYRRTYRATLNESLAEYKMTVVATFLRTDITSDNDNPDHKFIGKKHYSKNDLGTGLDFDDMYRFYPVILNVLVNETETADAVGISGCHEDNEELRLHLQINSREGYTHQLLRLNQADSVRLTASPRDGQRPNAFVNT
ncbi:hypothetical protein KIN20_026099 [Parelaphostrongylus tenuis]|uniref:Uncharacterized protein n=1 Tax=Parelaphostrongylus tenuis TaxID=148309 RepID=A0AAD5NCD2_PARTN|nr:hypothetical protein KIN20_026099 [Parelaphostrongylus tenuis]